MSSVRPHEHDVEEGIAPWDGRRVPMTLLGGYLGSGKTTILNALLRTTDRPLAVLVNDVGEINIDTRLLRKRAGDTLELTGGCVCCSLREGLGAALLAAGLVRGGDGVNRRFHRELGRSREFARALILLRDCLLRLGERGVEALELGFGLLGNLALGVGVVAKGVGLAAGLRDPRGGADLPSLDLSLEHPRGAAFLDARGGEDVVVRARAGLADARAGLIGDARVMPRDPVLGVGGGVASRDARARRRGDAGRARPVRGRIGRGGSATRRWRRGVGDDVVAALLARRCDARSRVDVAMGPAGSAADVLGPLLHGVSVGDGERRGRRGRDEQQHQSPRPRPSGRAGARHRAPRARGINERPRSPLSK